MDIFDYLSKFRIYNCITVSREHYELDRVYSRPINVNDVDKGMKLLMCNWLPYQNSDGCTEVNDITRQDSWVISTRRDFTKNIELFPRKFSYSLNGCPLKAFVRVWGSFFNRYKIMARIQTGVLWRNYLALRWFHWRWFWNRWTWRLFMFLHQMVVPFLDFTSSHYIMCYRWYIECSDKYHSWSSIFRMLFVELWLLLIISNVIAAFSNTFVDTAARRIGKGTKHWQVC